jgi:hypothetical protein
VHQRKTLAESHRVDRQAVLVDQAVADQAVRDAGAAEDDQVLARLALERRDLVLERRSREPRVAPGHLGQALGEDDLGEGVHQHGHRIVRARPAPDHVLVGAASDHDGSDLTEQFQRGAVAPIAVSRRPQCSGSRANR